MGALGSLEPADVAAVMTTYHGALRSHQDVINRLNVYPVPDGDTGTNMTLTVQSVVDELAGVGPDGLPDGPERPSETGVSRDAAGDMGAVCRAIAHGSLMGARGNSGVILSQLLRGLTTVFSSDGAPGPEEVAQALEAASTSATQAVLRPVEGTILTVARAAAEGGRSAAAGGAQLLDVLESARAGAADALARTPELLPVLAQAGVVDAGGAGYLLLLDSFLAVTDGRPIPNLPVTVPVGVLRGPNIPEDEVPPGMERPSDLRFEVMYLLEARDETIPAFKEVWAGLGDSIVIVGGDGLWNCHIHTNDVGASIEAALDAGRPRDIRVTDLIEQVEEERWVREGAQVPVEEVFPEPPPRTAVVAVANGEGIRRIFRSLGVHHIIPGGQSMNPSTAEILEFVERVPSPEVVLLPNNHNIHPVALQVCELATKPVRMVPTSGIVEGFAALLEYDPEASAGDNCDAMAASARRVVAGEVTRAVRDATVAAGNIVTGDWIGLSREGVEVIAHSLADATCGLLDKLLTDRHELVTLIEGEGAGAGDTRRVTEWLAERRPDVSVEVHHGGQPLYPYLLSIE